MDSIPADFPYWEHIVQRRYDGPSAIYLGNRWAMTARHVGVGEIVVQGENVLPEFSVRHTLLNVDGSAADVVIFKMRDDASLPDLPILPIASSPPAIGDEVLLIGFGRVRDDKKTTDSASNPFATFHWTETREKRWGTNRIDEDDHWLYQQRWVTRSLGMRFDRPGGAESTPHEALAAEGDSGGAVFAKIDDTWQLVGLITSVTRQPGQPPASASYGNIAYAADLSFYRDEIFRWTRPQCMNEMDDDGDETIDYPEDPDCRSPEDDRERAKNGIRGLLRRQDFGWLALAAVLSVVLVFRVRSQLGRSNPDSTSSSSAT